MNAVFDPRREPKPNFSGHALPVGEIGLILYCQIQLIEPMFYTEYNVLLSFK